MMVKEVTFVLEDNSQMYTGNTIEIDVGSPNLSANEGGWFTGNDPLNRRVQGQGGVNRFRSQLIDGQTILWASENDIQTGKDQFAVVAAGVNFDHIWSSWRGQRWVNRANVDDGIMSFKDLVDFHKDEVFSTFSLPTDSLTWIDENTLDLSNNEWLTLGLNSNYSMSFTYADSTTIVRGGGDNQSFGNRTVTLNWVQFTDSSGEVIVVEDGVQTEGMQVYDESNVYVGRDETVVREETISTPNLTTTEYTWRIIHVTQSDFIETGDVDESQNYWQVQSQLESTSRGWDYGGTRYDNQLDADNALDAVIEERMNTNNTVGQNNALQAATDAALAKQKAAKEKKDSWFSTIDKDDMKSLLFGGALVVLGVLLVSVLVKKGGGEGGE
jgi:hypothetical protein